MVYRFVSLNTVDEKILAKAESKRKLETLVLGKGVYLASSLCVPGVLLCVPGVLFVCTWSPLCVYLESSLCVPGVLFVCTGCTHACVLQVVQKGSRLGTAPVSYI